MNPVINTIGLSVASVGFGTRLYHSAKSSAKLDFIVPKEEIHCHNLPYITHIIGQKF